MADTKTIDIPQMFNGLNTHEVKQLTELLAYAVREAYAAWQEAHEEGEGSNQSLLFADLEAENEQRLQN